MEDIATHPHWAQFRQLALPHGLRRSRRLARFYAASNSINDAITRHRDIHEIYASACRLPVEQEIARLAWVGSIDTSEGRLRAEARFGNDSAYVDELLHILVRHANEPAPVRQVLKLGARVICHDIRSFPDCPWKAARAEPPGV